MGTKTRIRRVQDSMKAISVIQPLTYQIEVQGRIDDRWRELFAGMEIVLINVGISPVRTRLTGKLPDQAALVGLIRNLYDRGYLLLSVACLDLEGLT